MKISFRNETDYQWDEKRLTRLVGETLRQAGRELADISLVMINPPTMHKLNKEHRGKDYATDVLSFPFPLGWPQGDGGEVLVCPAVADKNAAGAGRNLSTELEILVVHGVLHLLGREDETAAGAARMDEETTAVLESVHG